ncbi:MAG: prepilin-type N-terminal cleavage/methylation domain-containing protein [Bdellovibrionota bacterium]
MINRAFTLIELMVTVVIIGILAVTAYTNFTKYKNKALLADAYQAIDIFSKSEISYHIQYNTFISTVSVKWDNPFDSQRRVAFASDTASGDVDKLEALGWPIAQNTMVPYIMQAFIGKTDESGTELNGDTWSKGFPWPGFVPKTNPIIWLTDRGSSICAIGPTIVSAVRANQLGAIEFARITSAVGRVPDWATVNATVNLTLGDDYCTSAVSLITFDGSNYTRSTIVRFGGND